MKDERKDVWAEGWLTRLWRRLNDGCWHKWISLGEYGDDGRRCTVCEQEWETRVDHSSGEPRLYEVRVDR